jgi:predicted Ser/Thr protein kinase
VSPAPLAADSAILTLLTWSDQPLDVFLDDERAPIARVPTADRTWLAEARAALLVPIFAGGSDPRPLVGLMAVGPKRSEERYTREDHELLRGIAVQMGVALDLSRLRRKTPGVFSTPDRENAPGLDSAPTVLQPSGRTASSIGVGVVVGQGGMGAVYRAWDLRLERSVAIKVVRPDMLADPESRARFRREAQVVARLQHPAIVTVFDYGALEDGAAFLVMEFVQGEDLRQLMRREGTLPRERTVGLVQGIAGGVEAAHQSGILHRDLKPENILLPSSGVGPKVVDFGVAKVTATSEGGTLTAGGTIVGTPAYMAPEQLRGETVDPRADVFSLGVMTYEMLSGRLPYGTGSFVDIGVKQAAGESAVDTSGLAPAVAGVILRAIAYDRERRPASPAAFARDLAEAR